MTHIAADHPFAVYCSSAADAAARAIRLLGPRFQEDGRLKAGSSSHYSKLESSLSKLLNMAPQAMGVAIQALEQIRLARASAPEEIKNQIVLAQAGEPYFHQIFAHFYAGIQAGVVTENHLVRLLHVHADLKALEQP